ncbi:hypothetical protein TREMEDRAFT_68547 [Tremella mesenterica DSM 1558]|uniref:uncharacterized protein n=1 Tax=Tremella mesenterica (strain ATCC 24925 / CBS 8224 / DSM 1558 / NBRC 9311 / NRRL Y-6157 / RJB 2259-6 / UBC 559-6) TaxID=578456 RepID=UPI0003F4A292|nr:uncharacterized protein TREMEDRAFT_68547 [Tremella mesenterica DSM 1558]EIW70202.1 hypothetical protein TREMEDRAFT_68547 [Tremella mesenterica DSM 1558]
MLAQVEADRRIIADLESRLPRWEGPKEVIHGDTAPGGIPGSGWFGEGAPQYEQSVGGPASWPDGIRRVVHALSEYRDISGRLLVDTLNQVPTLVDIPYLSFNAPISFSSIHTNAQSSRYRTLRAFDLDMVRLFEKSRRWFQGRTQEYGHVLELQRLYNSLTAPFPMNLPPSGVPPPSPTHFASIPAGPGNARFTHELAPDAKSSSEPVGRHFTTFRIGTKDREFTQEARHKGLTYKLGDYVHVMNPDDPSRPIVGQIFKTFVPTKGNRTHHITICWYFRPEQTVHTADRTFHENEIFKTGHFCDHPVEDIIERVSVSFYVKYIRGRPQAPEYYPGWPIYICVARYNDQKQMSVRIKNWASCIPDELRQTDFMTVIPFARQIDPIKVPSPFLRGIKGPGFLGDPQESVGDEDDDEDEGENRRMARVSTREVQKPEQPVVPNIGTNVQAGPSRPTQYIPSQPVPTRQVWSAAPTPPSNSTKSFVNLMGGPQVIDHLAVRELLPPETAQLFERDSRGHVLWFSGPPLPLGAIPVPEQPSHSIEYLEYLAKRRRRYTGNAGLSNGPVNSGNKAGDGVEVEVEDLTKIWWAQDQTPGKILDALRSVVDSI